MVEKLQPGYQVSMGTSVSVTSPKYSTPEPAIEYVLGAIGAGGSKGVAKYTQGNRISYTNGKQKFNYCNHVSESFTLKDERQIPLYFVHGPYRGLWYASAYAGSTTSPTISPVDPDMTISDQMRRRAWEELLPSLNDGFSMINFLVELPELLIMKKQLISLSNKIRKLDRSLFSLKTAAELELAYAFAVVPLMADIKALYENLFSTEDVVERFIANGRKLRNYHYTEKLNDTTSFISTTSYGKVLRDDSLEYHATLRCKYAYEKPSFLRGFRRVLGLRITPEAIWNAIPFSFMLDWVLRIGDSLRQFDRDPSVRVELFDYCDSLKKITRYREIRDRSGSSIIESSYRTWYMNGSDGKDVWVWERSHYLRDPGLPDTGFYFPAMDDLSFRELVLAGALAVANL